MNSEQLDYMDRVTALIAEIKDRSFIDYSTLKVGDYIISDRGQSLIITKTTPKTIKCKRLVCKRAHKNEGYVTAKERKESFDRDYLEKHCTHYPTTREEIIILARGMRLYYEKLEEDKIVWQAEAIKLSEEFTQLENDQLDRLVEKYNLTKDCDCITHEGPHFIHMQRYEISVSAKHMASLSLLSNSAFSRNEYTRLGDLARYMESLERVKNDVQPLHKGEFMS